MDPLNFQEVGNLLSEFFQLKDETSKLFAQVQTSLNTFTTNLHALHPRIEAIEIKFEKSEKAAEPLIERAKIIYNQVEERNKKIEAISNKATELAKPYVGKSHRQTGIVAGAALGIGGLALMPSIPVIYGITLFGAGVDGLFYSLNAPRFTKEQFFKHTGIGGLVSLATGSLFSIGGPIRDLAKRLLFQSGVNTLGGVLKKGLKGESFKIKDIAIAFFAGSGAACVRVPLDKLIGMPEEFLTRILFEGGQSALSSGTYQLLLNACQGKPLAQGVVQSSMVGGAMGVMIAIPEAIKYEQIKAEYQKQKQEIEDLIEIANNMGKNLNSDQQIRDLVNFLKSQGYYAQSHGHEYTSEEILTFLKMGIPLKFYRGNSQIRIGIVDGSLELIEANRQRGVIVALEGLDNSKPPKENPINIEELKAKSQALDVEFAQYKQIEKQKGKPLAQPYFNFKSIPENSLLKKFKELDEKRLLENAPLLNKINDLKEFLNKPKPIPLANQIQRKVHVDPVKFIKLDEEKKINDLKEVLNKHKPIQPVKIHVDPIIKAHLHLLTSEQESAYQRCLNNINSERCGTYVRKVNHYVRLNIQKESCASGKRGRVRKASLVTQIAIHGREMELARLKL